MILFLIFGIFFIYTNKKIESGSERTLETKINELELSLIENWGLLFPNQRPEICLLTEKFLKESQNKKMSKSLRLKIEKLIKKCQIMKEFSQYEVRQEIVPNIAEMILQYEQISLSNKKLKQEMEIKYRQLNLKDKNQSLPQFHLLMTQLIIISPKETLSHIEETIEKQNKKY